MEMGPDEGGNGDGTVVPAIDVEVEEVEAAAEGVEAKELLDEVLIEVLKKAKAILAQAKLGNKDYFKLAGIVAKLAPMALPKLSSTHNVHDSAEKLFDRMKREFSVEDAKKAIAARERRLSRLGARTRASRRPGRPPLAESVEPDGS